MAYMETHDLREYLGIEAEDDNDLLQDAIEDAEEYIDSQTNRTFEAATLTKRYDRSALDDEVSTILHLDEDCLTVTELLNGDADNTEIVAANYWLIHRNFGPPYRAIQLTINDGIYWQWDIDEWVSVTGTWGYSATVPADIRRACTVLAAYFFRQKDSQVFDTTAIPEAGVITIPAGIPATVTKVIERYKKYL